MCPPSHVEFELGAREMRVTRLSHPVFAGRYARVRDVPRDNLSLFHALAIALNRDRAQERGAYDERIGLALRDELVTRERCARVNIDYDVARSSTQHAGTELCRLAASALNTSIVLVRSAQTMLDTLPDSSRVILLAHLVHQQHYEPIVALPEYSPVSSTNAKSRALPLEGTFARDAPHVVRIFALSTRI